MRSIGIAEMVFGGHLIVILQRGREAASNNNTHVSNCATTYRQAEITNHLPQRCKGEHKNVRRGMLTKGSDTCVIRTHAGRMLATEVVQGMIDGTNLPKEMPDSRDTSSRASR